jgi:hypothetical protein
MLARTKERIEAALYRRGFTVPEVRQVVRNQVLLAMVSTVAGLLCLAITPLALHFALGALLVTVNFYALAKFVQEAVYVKQGQIVALLVQFYGRLLLTGLLLFAMVVWLEVSVAALSAGLSTLVVTIVTWGATQIFGHKVKEA